MKVISGYKIHESITTGGHKDVWCFECSFVLCSNTCTLQRAQLGGMPHGTHTALRLLRADHSEWYDTAEVRRRGLSGSQCGLEHQYARTFAHTWSLKNLFHLKKINNLYKFTFFVEYENSSSRKKRTRVEPSRPISSREIEFSSTQRSTNYYICVERIRFDTC